MGIPLLNDLIVYVTIAMGNYGPLTNLVPHPDES
jgi:hypothetical protein